METISVRLYFLSQGTFDLSNCLSLSVFHPHKVWMVTGHKSQPSKAYLQSFAKQSKESYACLILNDALTYATTLRFSPLNFKIIFTLTCNATPATDTAPPADLV